MFDLRAFWARLVDGLWFVPGTIVVGAIVLAVAMVEVSTVVDSEALSRWPRIFGASPDGARSMLAAIAGSMITVAGVTFSITMVAVTQASSQYTPRILRNFMRDRANQAVLGIFVGIFAYCLVVLRTIRVIEDGSDFVPSLAVFLGVLLAIAGIAVLIFFVHHIATTLQASQIVARVARETMEAVDRLFPEKLGEGDGGDEAAEPPPPVAPDRWQPVAVPKTGYIQRVDWNRLVRVAGDRDLLIRLEREVGDFVAAGLPLAWVTPHPGGSGSARPHHSEPERDRDSLEDAVTARFTISTYRTIDQDVGFGVRQMVDIALKALSPGINDTTTAVTCVDYLGAVLAHLLDRRVETPSCTEDGVTRLMAPGPTFASLVDAAFDEVRRHAGGNVSVLARQLAALELLAGHTASARRREILLKHVGLVEETGDRTVALAHDKARLKDLAARARAAAYRGAEATADGE